MASNERENARRERQRKNDAKTKKIIWGILIGVVIILIIMKICEVDFNSLKNRFTDADGHFTLALTTDETAYPLTLDTSQNVKVNVTNDKLNVLTATSVSVINPTNAKVLYKFDHGYSNPMIRYAGSYYCLYDQGSTRLRLDNAKGNEYETTTDNPILTADVCKNGTVAYATRSSDEKSTLYVYDNQLNQKLVYDENDGYIVSVAIDPSGKKCAFAAISSANGQIVTTVYTINVGSDKPIASFEYADTNLINMKYANSSDLYFVGDDCLSIISKQEKETKVYEKDSVSTVNYCYTDDNQLVYIYSKYAESDACTMEYITSSGKVKTSVDLAEKVKYVSSTSNEACVLFDGRAETYSITKGELKGTYTCPEDTMSVHKLSSKVYINRQQLIELINDKE